VRLEHTAADGLLYGLNLIDTPGHVDFSYEVSRSLQACEGAILVVDATQGIEAQTLANVHLALKQNLTIIPVLNKIDLPSAQPDVVIEELENVLAMPREEVLLASAKDGTGVAEILEAIVQRIPPPKGDPEAPLQGLIFDSHYDAYKGVVVYIRLAQGTLRAHDVIRLMGSGAEAELIELGYFRPQLVAMTELHAGDVGYVATGLKSVREAQVGDTVTTVAAPAAAPLPGYQPAKSLVFAGIYPIVGSEYPNLRDAMEKLHLNDASFSFEPESSVALGFGFRCGFLGLLHMEIIEERLEREFGQELIASAPSVKYQVVLINGQGTVSVDNPSKMPDAAQIEEILEPWVKLGIVTPSTYIGTLMELTKNRRGAFLEMEYLDPKRVLLNFELPLGEVIVDFFDQLKTRTQGYASMDFEEIGYRAERLVKVDVLVAGEPVDALSVIVHRDRAQAIGRELVHRLRGLIPRQMFEIAVQAAIGSNVIARESVAAMRKNVLAKCYGGDITRKRKLLEKQKEGKQRMKRVGSVEIPQEAFLAVLRMDDV
jgi:GTP-binding protein LepA